MSALAKAPAVSLTLSAKALKSAVGPASKAAATRTTLPVLQNLLLRAEDGWLTVTGNDLAGAVRVRVRCPTPDDTDPYDVAFTVGAKRLADFCATLPDHQPVTISASASAAVLTCARSRARLTTIDAEEMPLFPGDSDEGRRVRPFFTVEAERLARALKGVEPFCGSDKSHPVVPNVMLSVEDGKLVLAATDRYAGVRHSGLSGVDGGAVVTGEGAGVLLPAEHARRFAEFCLLRPAELCTVSLVQKDDEDPTGLLLQVGNVALGDDSEFTVYGRLAEGKPIDFKRMLRPKGEEDPLITADPALLAQVVARVALFGADGISGAAVTLAVTGAGYETQGALTVAASEAETGEGVDQIDCEVMTGYGDPLPEGDVLWVKVGSRYVLDGLRAMRDARGGKLERVFLGIKGPGMALMLNDGMGDYIQSIGQLNPRAGEGPVVAERETPPVAAEAEVDEFAPEDLGDE